MGNLCFVSDLLCRYKDQVVFKGGTSLSKCYSIIERFSEDIDLVLLSEKGDSGNKLKAISFSVAVQLAEIEVSELTNKKGMIRDHEEGGSIIVTTGDLMGQKTTAGRGAVRRMIITKY